MGYKFEKYFIGGGGSIIDVAELPTGGGTPVIGTWTNADMEAIEDPTTISPEVENIYFNTALSTEEVVEILSKLTFTPTGEGDIVFSAYGANLTAPSQVALGFIRLGTEYAIMSYVDELIMFATDGLAAEMGTTGGWNPDFNGTYAVNGILVKPREVTPLGLPVDNQQEKYAGLMSLTPGFEPADVDETAIYRVTKKVDADVYYRYDAEDPAGYCNLKDLAALEGIVCNPVYYVVDALPENPEVSNLLTFNPGYCYIVNDIPYMYGDAGSGNVWLTATELLAMMGTTTTDHGFTADITKETVTGIFVTYKKEVALYYYKDGEWHGGGGSGIVDVEALPSLGGTPVIGTWTDTQNAPTEVKVDKIYLNTKLTAAEVQSALSGCTKVDGVDIPFCVLASGVDVSTNKQHSIVVEFLPVERNVPGGIFEVIGSDLDTTDESLITKLWVNENFAAEMNSPIVGWNTEFDGAIKINGDLYAPGTVAGTVDFVDTQPEVPVTQDPSKHIDLISMTSQFGNAEEIDETVIYRTEGSGGAQLWFKSGDNLVSLDQFAAQFAGTTVTYYVVDSLPSNPVITSNDNGYHVYVLKSTGAAYGSMDGSTYSPMVLVGVSKGWINSLDEMTEDGDYTLRVGGGTAYGIPTSNAAIYRFEDGKWIELNALAGEELAVLNKQIETLEGTIAEQTTEIDTLEDTIAKNTAKIKPLKDENALLSARLAGLDSGDEGGENFARYATLKNKSSGIEITDITDTSITSITIPEGVTSIGISAFDGCSSLTSITIPDSVTSIGYRAFYHCSKLTEITIPDDVTSIGNEAFYRCSSLTEITIPDSVTSIGMYTFCGCKALTEITIPSSVTSIGISAFNSCSGLTEITIPDSVTSIGNEAFCHCSSLTSIIIPDSVTSIGDEVFYYCSKLTEITIPNNVTSIGGHAFQNCSSLTSIDIPDGVTSIGDWTFGHCEALTSITLPDGLTSIGNYAFYECASLTEITIPEGVTSIGDWTFYGCSGLTSITVADGNTAYHSSGNCLIETDSGTLIVGCNNSVIPADGTVTSIGERAFIRCSGLTEINIPDGVTSIGNNAFCDCSGLTEITIPDSVTNIGSYAFYECTSLTEITIPDGVTSIGDRTFYGCSGLTSVTIGSGVTSIGVCAFQNCSSLTEINIPDGVTSIGDGAFLNCSGLTSVTIPDGVTGLGQQAFKGCSNLTSVTIPGSVTSVGDFAFQYCASLTEVTISDGATSIGHAMFSGCSSLTSITIPDSVTNIGAIAFADCSSLTEITIPDSVTSIGNNAFEGCSGLTSITIPDGVTSIGYGTFDGCSSLTSITIPDSVTSIGEYAFFNCSSLTSIDIPDGVTSIGVGAFYDCSVLTEITIPDGVTSIGRSAFDGCSGLTSIDIPDGVTSIGDWTFDDCSGLTEIAIHDSVTSIGDYAFRRCSSLTEIAYNGTKEQWKAITFGTGWNQNTGNYTITCTDGTIAKDGTET